VRGAPACSDVGGAHATIHQLLLLLLLLLVGLGDLRLLLLLLLLVRSEHVG